MASNNSTNLTATSDLFGRGNTVQIIFEVFFAVFICLVSILGNFLVVFVIHQDSRLKNITNVFIHTLAWTDICTAALVMPFWIVTLYSERWIFSTELCEWTATMQFICANASVWTMAVIAVNRYLKVVKPHIYPKFFSSIGIARVYSVSVWLLAVLFSTPPLYGWGQYAFHQRAALCTLIWEMENISYAIIFVGILFSGMSFVIVFCYYKIYREVKASSNNLRAYAAQNVSSASLNTLSRGSTDIKLLKATFTVVCVYAACWAPGALVILSETIFGPPPGFVNTVVVYLVFCSSGVNPIIYGVMNPQFKRAFAKVLRCKKSEEESQTNQAATATQQPVAVVEDPRGGIPLSEF